MDFMSVSGLDLDTARHILYMNRCLICRANTKSVCHPHDWKEMIEWLMPKTVELSRLSKASVFNPTFNERAPFAPPLDDMRSIITLNHNLVLEHHCLGNTFRFLDLPGEVRNKIYRFCLISKRTFSIKLRFPSFDTSLLRVSKKIFYEASSIFYHDNVFKFPQPLFVGAEIMTQIRDVYHVPACNLQKMKQLMLDIPVYSDAHDDLLVRQTAANLKTLWTYVSENNGDELKLQANYYIAWGGENVRIPPSAYDNIFLDFGILKDRKEGNVECNLEVQPHYMDDWVDVLQEQYGKYWTLLVRIQNSGRTAPDVSWGAAIMRFRDRYMLVPGVKEYYEEPTAHEDFYAFRPRRKMT